MKLTSCFDSNLPKTETKLCIVSLIITSKVATVKFISKVPMDFNQVLNLFFLSVSFPLLSPSQYQGQPWRGKKVLKDITLQEVMGAESTDSSTALSWLYGGGVQEGMSQSSVCACFSCRSFKVLSHKTSSIPPTAVCSQALPLRHSGTISALEISLPASSTLRNTVGDRANVCVFSRLAEKGWI